MTVICWIPGVRQWLVPCGTHSLLLAAICAVDRSPWTVLMLVAVLAGLGFDLRRCRRVHGQPLEFAVPTAEPGAAQGDAFEGPTAYRACWCVAGWINLELRRGTDRRRIDVFADEVSPHDYAVLARWARS